MSNFKYRGRLPDGRLTAGVVEADTKEAAQQALTDRSVEILLLEEQKGTEVSNVAGGLMGILNKPTVKDLVVATRTLSVMVSAAISIPDALRNISALTKNPVLKAVMTSVAAEVEGGGRFSDALEHYPKIFSTFFVNMIRSGETTGQLGEVLEYLADQQEKDYDLSAKLKGAMIYPAFVVTAMGIVGFVMLTFVVPKLTEVLVQAHVPLPLATRGLIAISSFLQNYWYIAIGMVVSAIALFRWWSNTVSGHRQWDRIKLSLPVFGNLLQKMYVVRFSRSLSTLIKGGMDIVGALEIVAAVVGNETWKKLIYETIAEVNSGNPLATAFARYKFVPPMMTQMLSVGEGTGKTHEILFRLSNFYAREVDDMTGNMTKIIEPLVLLVLGGAVGVMVVAILLPMYQLSSGG